MTTPSLHSCTLYITPSPPPPVFLIMYVLAVNEFCLNDCVQLDFADGRVLTIEDLKRRNGISDFLLDSEIDEKDLHSLAGCFDNVEDYLDVLKLTEGQQTDVKDIVFHKKSTQSGMTKALKLWRQPNPPIATYRNLLLLLLELKKGDVACKCCNLLCPKFLPGTPDVGTSNSLHVSQLDEGIVYTFSLTIKMYPMPYTACIHVHVCTMSCTMMVYM